MDKLKKIIEEKYYTKYFNEDDTSLLTKELISRNNLDNYINNVMINNNKMIKRDGAYEIKSKTIYINPEIIIDNAIRWANTLPYDISDIGIKKLSNLLILETINHEIRHAIQNKKADNIDNNPENIIIKEGIDFCSHKDQLLSVKDRMFYKFLYKDVLVEREASIMALVSLLELDKEIDFISQFEKSQYINPRLMKKIRDGYTLKSCPAEKYFKLKFKYKQYKNIIKYIKYDYQTALSLGLPIDKETYIELKTNDEETIINKMLIKK